MRLLWFDDEKRQHTTACPILCWEVELWFDDEKRQHTTATVAAGRELGCGLMMKRDNIQQVITIRKTTHVVV